MRRHNAISRRVGEVIATAPDIAKLKMLLRLEAGSVDRWAEKYGFRGQEVHMTLSGTRPYPAIREQIAASANLSLEQLEAIIEKGKAVRASA